MDDAGYKLIEKSQNKGFFNFVGKSLVKALPIIIKALSIIGTIALLLVSGGIFDHNIELVHQFLPKVTEMAKHALYGVVAGLAMFVIVSAGKKVYSLLKN